MVIDDFNIDRAGRSLGPLKANPPLVVDTDAVLALAVALERFEPIAGQIEIVQRRGRVELVELHFGLALNPGKSLDPVPLGELPSSLVSEAHDHGSPI
jgi:hypothetical protein